MPEHTHNQWARQWNRYACTVSDCTMFRTLDKGIEYDDPTGHLDPYEIESVGKPLVSDSQAQQEQSQLAEQPKRKGKKQADAPNVTGETADDLVAVLGEGNDNGTVGS